MESFLKRKSETLESQNKKPKMEACPHDLNCYRRNPHHFKEWLEAPGEIPENGPQSKTVYLEQLELLRPLVTVTTPKHPSPSSTASTSEKPLQNDAPAAAGTMLDRLQKAAPYNLFFTKIPNSTSTLSDLRSITFTDLLCPSLGALKCSLQINFMIDIMWLIEQYKARKLEKKPLTIVYGDDWPDMQEFIKKNLPNVTHHLVKMKDPFGCHHSKVGIYIYEDNSLRVVVSTANLYYEDWNNYNQGLWVSPLCPPLPTPSATQGDSPTGFKSTLLKYLKHYNLQVVNPWITYVENADFSGISVALVISIPGRHLPDSVGSHVHHVAHLLKNNCVIPKNQEEKASDWRVIAQASSIGSLGKTPGEWFRSVLLRSLAAHDKLSLSSSPTATISVVFPTVNNVINGYFGPQSGGCLPYQKSTDDKQKWLKTYLCQWKADALGRSKAMPHIKTYCRVSPCLKKLAWFLITSSNISKSAWGGAIQKNGTVYVRSCEVGVMFLPKYFQEEVFVLGKTMNSKNANTFPFIYDLPLLEYRTSDSPWCN